MTRTDALEPFLGTNSLRRLLRLFREAKYYFAKPNIPRGLDVGILHENAKKHGLKGDSDLSVKSAMESAINRATPTDLIFIGGSTFTVAEVV